MKNSTATNNKKRKLSELAHSAATAKELSAKNPSKATESRGKSVEKKKLRSENRAREDSIERAQEVRIGKSESRAREED
jgi:hypothetical protein